MFFNLFETSLRLTAFNFLDNFSLLHLIQKDEEKRTILHICSDKQGCILYLTLKEQPKLKKTCLK